MDVSIPAPVVSMSIWGMCGFLPQQKQRGEVLNFITGYFGITVDLFAFCLSDYGKARHQ